MGVCHQIFERRDNETRPVVEQIVSSGYEMTTACRRKHQTGHENWTEQSKVGQLMIMASCPVVLRHSKTFLKPNPKKYVTMLRYYEESRKWCNYMQNTLHRPEILCVAQNKSADKPVCCISQYSLWT